MDTFVNFHEIKQRNESMEHMMWKIELSNKIITYNAIFFLRLKKSTPPMLQMCSHNRKINFLLIFYNYFLTLTLRKGM